MKRFGIFLITVLVFVLSGCWPGSRVMVVEFPGAVENVTYRTSVPLYNKSSYFAEVYVRGREVAWMPPGASFQTIASVPFVGTEIPIAALLYGPGDQYVGCYTDVLYLSYYRTSEFRITDGRIKYIDENYLQPTERFEYKKKGWVEKHLPVPQLKHTLMVQVVYNSNLAGVLRMNGVEVEKFTGGPVHGRERIYLFEKNLLSYRRYGEIIFDVKYFRGEKVFGYSREGRVNYYISRPKAYQFVFGPDFYKD